MSQGEARCNIIQVGMMIPGEVSWPYREVRRLQVG